MPDGLAPVYRAATSGEFEAAARSMLAVDILRLDRGQQQFRAEAGRRTGPLTDLWFCDYGIRVTLAFPEAGYVRVQMPISGRSLTEDGGRVTAVCGRTGCISERSATVAFETGFTQYAWRIPIPELTRKLATLIGEPIIHPIEFEPVLDLDRPLGRRLTHLVSGLLEIPLGDACSLERIADAEAEQAMMATFLLASRHNYSAKLEDRAHQTAPKQVRVVERYIEEHWNEPVDYEVLVDISGVSIRSLFRTFKSFRGYTPMEFAKKIRLSKAREMLVSGPPGMTISAIAYACGFPNLSAFSRDFAAAYGLSPSAARRSG